MSEDNFKDFIDRVENPKKEELFIICGEENEKGECCLWQKGHKGSHEFHSGEEIKKEALQKKKLIEPEGGFVFNGDVISSEDTNLNLKHNKAELFIAITILGIAFAIGIFLLIDNYNEIVIFLENSITGDEVIIQDTVPPKDTENYYEIFTDGKFKIEYYDGSNIPKELFGEGDSKIPFECWTDQSDVQRFLGIIQIIEGEYLYSDLHIIGYYPSLSNTIGEGQSLTWEGECTIK